MKTQPNRHHTALVAQLCVTATCFYACMHKKSELELQAGTQSSVPGWIDLSTIADGKTRQLCPSRSIGRNDEVQCAFRDSSTGLIWSSRAPGQDGFHEAREYLTWSEAKSACEKIGQWSGLDGWRLPTEAELKSAFLTPSGTIRQSGLLVLTDRVSSFGALPKFSLIWSINEDPQNPTQAKALLRGANNISIGTVAKDMARGWHCVHSTAISKAPPLPTVRPESPSKVDFGTSAILGRSNTSIAAPTWTIKPINDFDRLSFILNSSDTASDSANNVPKPEVKSLAEGTAAPPELPAMPAESTGKPIQPNKSFVKALKKAFAKIGLAHAIDDSGRLILNRASGIRFPSGEGSLSRSSLPRAKIMLKIYTEVLLAELPESASSARLAVVGYSIPNLRMSPASTEQANRKVSRSRAAIIRELITEFNIWPPDQITIDGLGNMNPIKRKDRTQGECGIYDCELSRRVEVSPLFKEKTAAN